MGTEILKTVAECSSEMSVFLSHKLHGVTFQKDLILILKAVVNYSFSYENGSDEFEFRI